MHRKFCGKNTTFSPQKQIFFQVFTSAVSPAESNYSTQAFISRLLNFKAEKWIFIPDREKVRR
jgi:hypothetical protein